MVCRAGCLFGGAAVDFCGYSEHTRQTHECSLLGRINLKMSISTTPEDIFYSCFSSVLSTVWISACVQDPTRTRRHWRSIETTPILLHHHRRASQRSLPFPYLLTSSLEQSAGRMCSEYRKSFGRLGQPLWTVEYLVVQSGVSALSVTTVVMVNGRFGRVPIAHPRMVFLTPLQRWIFLPFGVSTSSRQSPHR